MLPRVIDEDQIFIFKFWFNGNIRQGMYFQNELYCKLQTFDIQQRSHVYQLGCKLTKKNAQVVLTCTQETCSLWGSLRGSVIKEILLGQKKSSESMASPSSVDPATQEIEAEASNQ